jgi:hypothetical protein
LLLIHSFTSIKRRESQQKIARVNGRLSWTGQSGIGVGIGCYWSKVTVHNWWYFGFLPRNNMLRMFKGDKSFIPKNISASQFMIVSWTQTLFEPYILDRLKPVFKQRRICSREQRKQQLDWLATIAEDITSQSHSLFACSPEKNHHRVENGR